MITKTATGLRLVVTSAHGLRRPFDSGEPLPFFYSVLNNFDGTGNQLFQATLKDGHTYEYTAQLQPFFQANQEFRQVNPQGGDPIPFIRGGIYFNAYLRNTLTWTKVFLF